MRVTKDPCSKSLAKMAKRLHPSVLWRSIHEQVQRQPSKIFSKASVSTLTCRKPSGSNLPRATPKSANQSNHHRPLLRLRLQPRPSHRPNSYIRSQDKRWAPSFHMGRPTCGPIIWRFRNKRWALLFYMGQPTCGPILWHMEQLLSNSFNCISRHYFIQLFSNSCQWGHFFNEGLLNSLSNKNSNEMDPEETQRNLGKTNSFFHGAIFFSND